MPKYTCLGVYAPSGSMIRVMRNPQRGQYTFNEDTGACTVSKFDAKRKFKVDYIYNGAVHSHDIKPMREPDLTIGSEEDPYLKRWWVIPRNPVFNIYLHNIIRPDDDVLHDHPWWNISIVLKGGYVETTHKGAFTRRAGSVVFRFAKALHSLAPLEDCWSLFITGPRFRVWGFACPKGWIPYYVFKAYEPGTSGTTVNRGECP